MDAHIARGGISYVLSQARASLKNPSRPFTPRTDERPLFHGDDYRPGSRPSSSSSTAEQKEFTPTSSENRKLKAGPESSGAALPPRPTVKTAHKRTPAPTPTLPMAREKVRTKKDANPKPREPPRPQDHDSAGETDPSGDESEEIAEANEPSPSAEHCLGALVDTPSIEALTSTLHVITMQLDTLSLQLPPSITPQELEMLVRSLSEFTSNSGVFFKQKKTSNSSSPATANVAKVSTLRRRLFDTLVDLAVGPWHTSAKCVVAITPCLLELFDYGGDSSQEDAAAKLISLGKVLFVLSKETHNDAEFCNVRYVESALSLVTTTPVSTHMCPMKTLIYIAGTLKNVSSGDDKMLKLLATNGAIASLSEALAWRAADPSTAKEIAQFLVQTTTILRNLSTSKAYLKQFNKAQVASRLCQMVEHFLPHQELMVNVSRILGKLTLHEVPRSQINQDVEQHLGNLLQLVDPRKNKVLTLASSNEEEDGHNQGDLKTQDVLLVRIFFVLGNLCASNDRNRHFLGVDADAVPTLLQSLKYFGKKYVQRTETSNDNECADVLVKLVRLLANMAMNADVGVVINGYRDELAVLLEVLENTRDDEVRLNIVSCLTNLSYYATSAATSRSFIETHRVAITTLLSNVLWDPNEEAVLEAARAFGNLSRFKDVLRIMGETKVLDGFVILLDHSNREIVYTVCGVLMNAALDEFARGVLLNVRQVPSGVGDAVVIDARTLLTNILESAAVDDSEMSCIAAKVLYNLLLAKSSTGSERYAASDEGQSLQRIAASILRTLAGSESSDDDDDTAGTTRRDLRDVLTQLKTNLAR